MSLASPYVVANSIVPFLGKFIYVQLYMVLGWKTIVEITYDNLICSRHCIAEIGAKHQSINQSII